MHVSAPIKWPKIILVHMGALKVELGLTRTHLGESSTTRDLLMTNWFVLEVIIRMRVAGVWEFFSNDQWMWNLVTAMFVGSLW